MIFDSLDLCVTIFKSATVSLIPVEPTTNVGMGASLSSFSVASAASATAVAACAATAVTDDMTVETLAIVFDGSAMLCTRLAGSTAGGGEEGEAVCKRTGESLVVEAEVAMVVVVVVAAVAAVAAVVVVAVAAVATSGPEWLTIAAISVET